MEGNEERFQKLRKKGSCPLQGLALCSRSLMGRCEMTGELKTIGDCVEQIPGKVGLGERRKQIGKKWEASESWNDDTQKPSSLISGEGRRGRSLRLNTKH